jgi:hypothetical protein
MMIRIGIIANLLLIGAVGVSAQNAMGNGFISGTVIDEYGVPVPGAKAVGQKQTEFVRDDAGHLVIREHGFSRAVVVDENGFFTLADLPAGRYYVCTRGAADQVGDCEWEGSAVVSLSSGQSITNLKRVLRRGCVLNVHVSDPNRRTDTPDAMGNVSPEKRFFLGVMSDSGFYRRGEVVSQSETEKVYSVTVPRLNSVRLFIDADVVVTDDSERVLPTKRPSEIRVLIPDAQQYHLDLFIK